ncbi:1520_t:CDS:2, partial [Funneliformis mosseae]
LKNSEKFSKEDSSGEDTPGEDHFLGIRGPGPNEDNEFFGVVTGSSSSRRSTQYQTNSVYDMADNFHDMSDSQDNEEDGSSIPTFDHVDNVSSFKQNSYHSTINGSEIAPTSEFTYVPSIKHTNDGYYENTDICSTRKQTDILQNRRAYSEKTDDRRFVSPMTRNLETDNSLIQLHSAPSDLEEDEQNNRKITAPILTRKSNPRNKERVNYYVGSQTRKRQRNKPASRTSSLPSTPRSPISPLSRSSSSPPTPPFTLNIPLEYQYDQASASSTNEEERPQKKRQ